MTRTILIASEGMILTNGEIYGTKIYLAEGVSPDNFHEITLSDYEQLMLEQEAITDGDTNV